MASSSDRTKMMALFASMAFRATAAVGRSASCRSISFATALASRLEVVSRIAAASTSCSAWASMSAARKPGIAICGDDQNLGWAGHEVDADFPRQQFLGGGHVDIARSNDAVGAGHGARAEGECRDGLRSAHLKNLIHTQELRSAQNLAHRPRAGHANVGHARDLRGNDGHHQRGGQRITARRDVGGHGIERPHHLAQLQPGTHLRRIPAEAATRRTRRMLAAAIETASRNSAERLAAAQLQSAAGTPTDLRSSRRTGARIRAGP